MATALSFSLKLRGGQREVSVPLFAVVFAKKKRLFFSLNKYANLKHFGCILGVQNSLTIDFFHFFWGSSFEDAFGLDFRAILERFRECQPSIHSPWRSRNARWAFLWKACETFTFWWKKTSKNTSQINKNDKKDGVQTNHFFKPFFYAFLWNSHFRVLGVGALFC